LGGYFVGRCSRQGTAAVQYVERSFDGTEFRDGGNALDFNYNAALDNNTFNIEAAAPTFLHVMTTSPILEKLWELATSEW
jgi:hypothetical protein